MDKNIVAGKLSHTIPKDINGTKDIPGTLGTNKILPPLSKLNNLHHKTHNQFIYNNDNLTTVCRLHGNLSRPSNVGDLSLFMQTFTTFLFDSMIYMSEFIDAFKKIL